MVFSMGLMTAAPMFWLTLYWFNGLQLSATAPFAYQIISVATLLIYIQTRSFDFFRYSQLGLFLFFPFIVQLSLGNFISASGMVLWSVLAPVVAIIVLSARESLPWFVGYLMLLLLCGYTDFELSGTAAVTRQVPLKTAMLFFALNFAAITSIVYLLHRFAAIEKERYELELENAHGLLKAEQERSERLLLNVLPQSVAERLKRDESSIADGFADVTVMFADVVNFTSIAGGMAPNRIFAMLNKIFSAFDQFADDHQLEKIKTIGDAYMVAGGLGSQPAANYTQGVAEMAIGMRALLATDTVLNDRGLELRIGIATGPVVAGVVGRKKFIYDLWGDTVNIASRLTSEGAPGMIQVDATTHSRLCGAFEFEPPQIINMKGKGNTTVYRLIGRKAGDHDAPITTGTAS